VASQLRTEGNLPGYCIIDLILPRERETNEWFGKNLGGEAMPRGKSSPFHELPAEVDVTDERDAALEAAAYFPVRCTC
jgi:hypothetical protein